MPIRHLSVRKIVALSCLVLWLTHTIATQKTWQETALAINIEVPVRVYDKNSFVGHLSMDDFELFENGVPQQIEAVYLINKDKVLRKEEIKQYKPQTTRNFFLLFEVSSYSARLQDAMQYFMHAIYVPGDDLIVVTPRRTYRLKEESKKGKTREAILEELKELIRPDAVLGNAEFRTLVKELEDLSKSMTTDIEVQLGIQQTGETMPEIAKEAAAAQRIALYASLMSQLQTYRQADELRLLDLAKYLKGQSGQSYVFMFYEKKFIPQINPQLLRKYLGLFTPQSYAEQMLSSTLDYNKQETYLDVERVTQAFADTSTSVHFLHISTPAQRLPGIYFEEYSQETFNILMETARATGGITDSSMNPDYLFKKAVDASENYYLIYYTPKDYKPDGSFKSIKVKVKGRNYRVTHRMGYFAD